MAGVLITGEKRNVTALYLHSTPGTESQAVSDCLQSSKFRRFPLSLISVNRIAFTVSKRKDVWMRLADEIQFDRPIVCVAAGAKVDGTSRKSLSYKWRQIPPRKLET